jgi:hypothetical protein
MSSVPRSAYVLSVVVLFGVGSFDRAHGAAILLSEQREISAEAHVFVGGPIGSELTDTDFAQSTPASAFTPWNDAVVASASVSSASDVAAASQISSITPTLFRASLNGATSLFGVGVGGVGTAIAVSAFDVAFELTTPHRFDLTGEMLLSDVPGSRTGLTFGFVGFGPPSHTFTNITPIAAAGILDPGVYSFQAELVTMHIETLFGAETFGSVQFDFALTNLAQVPEPSALLLLGAVAAAGAWFGRRSGVRVTAVGA